MQEFLRKKKEARNNKVVELHRQLRLAGRNKTDADYQIARRMGISVKTVVRITKSAGIR